MIPSQIIDGQKYPHVKGVCSKTLDLYIMDLRSMLQLPLRIAREKDLPPGKILIDMEGGCNFASCTLILDMISGLSVCLYFKQNKVGLDATGDRGYRFKDLLENYYPWEYENLDKKEVSMILWQLLRNPLVHTLGILPLVKEVNRVQINKSALDLQQILDWENISRPPLSSTFELESSTFHVNIPPFYWGLHQLFRNLFSDANQMLPVEARYVN